MLGDIFEFDADLFLSIQEFFCNLYGLKKTADVNKARYLKFCSNKGKIPEPQQLPPTSDELYLHCQRVSCSTAIGNGWKINNENALEVTWMTQKPAPESILELVSCRCNRLKCKDGNCVSHSYGLKCTDHCECAKCESEEVENEFRNLKTERQ